jgi:alpha-glucosidase
MIDTTNTDREGHPTRLQKGINLPTTPWWRDATCYEIYVRSFADANGDGVGDLAGVTSRLPYLARLGIDAIWLTPFYASPQIDHGYDVMDHRAVDSLFGDLEAFDVMLAAVHDCGMRLLIDIVPNHTSDRHPWFQAALAAGAGNDERDRYWFRPGRGRSGGTPPNNWKSMFGGPAWSRVPDGDWYLHLFDGHQPDLNWRRGDVGDEFESILRFWLDRGVDGIRVDVAHALWKPPDLPDATRRNPTPYLDLPGVHDIYRRWHATLRDYPGDRMGIAEAWVATPQAMARYIRPDELQQAFNFHWLLAPWSAAAFRRVITETFAAVDPVNASPTWVLSNHDVQRHVSRYGGGRRGLARARAATLTMLGLPGSAYLYAGEELGLPQVDVPVESRQDPEWRRGDGRGRDGCRVPLPWSGRTQPYGFSSPGAAAPWLPQPDYWGALSVAAQEDDPNSTLHFYRQILASRRELAPTLAREVTLLPTSPGVLSFARQPGFVCVLNCSSRRARLPVAGDLLISSCDESAVRGGMIDADTAAWFMTR